jgi:hypothetical protein
LIFSAPKSRFLACIGIVASALVLCLVKPVSASELISLQVSNQDELYQMESESFLRASAPSLFQVLMDYDHFTDLSSVYEESRQLGLGPDGAPRVYTLAQGCMVFVCRSVEKVERLDTVPNRRIVATVIPELSNLHHGVTEWVLTPEQGGTRLSYRMELVPKFWVPPLIGPPIIRYVLAKGGRDALQRLEEMARQRDLSRPEASD